MKRSGPADLRLHYGYVRKWLTERIGKPGEEMLRRLPDPFWLQSLGAVMGMDES